MSYLDIYEIKREYRTHQNNIVKEFYIPVLEESLIYKRAVGYFTSGSLIEISKGISGLIKSKGKMQLIVSPFLSDEDITEINKGYSLRMKVEEAINREIDKLENENEGVCKRLSWLAYLIAEEHLDIKIAYVKNSGKFGLYHEKIGIMEDLENNKIAFTGSLNETPNAFNNNYESIDVFCSWKSNDYERVIDKEKAFDTIWKNEEINLTVIDFPEDSIEKLRKYSKEYSKMELDEDDVIHQFQENSFHENHPQFPGTLKLHDYQENAIKKWIENEYCGIFDMATGTGKTLTGLGAVTELFNIKKRLAVIIVCPYQHLVEQWVEDIEKFKMKPIIGYSTSPQKSWRVKLSDDILDYNLGILNFLCFVTTNSMFSTESIQYQLSSIKDGKLLLIDEAHNFGSTNLSKLLNNSYAYRIALSATLERHHDEDGTELLKNYFGDKCIEYDIELAINEGKLTGYFYHPIPVFLKEYELTKYREISNKIIKNLKIDTNGAISFSEYGKMLLIERARVIAGADNKITELKKVLFKHKKDSHILVYCGATKKNREFEELEQEEQNDEDLIEERQIVTVSKMIGNELGMSATHFTSNETQKERSEIKIRFENNDPYQVLVAIKCLDEGVNIPSIKIACILASSTNPKEYIQRRGRVLRNFPGKNEAIIYDFITLPYDIETISYDDNQKYDISLIKREINRMIEFGNISKNPSETDQLVKTLIKNYNLDLIGDEDNEFRKQL